MVEERVCGVCSETKGCPENLLMTSLGWWREVVVVEGGFTGASVSLGGYVMNWYKNALMV